MSSIQNESPNQTAADTPPAVPMLTPEQFVEQLRALRAQVADEFAKSGKAEDAVTFRCFVRMQYYGQLNDIEIYSPAQQLHDAADVDALIAAFEDAYGKVYARSARSPELGYLVTFAIVTGAVHVEKPALPVEPLVGLDPPAAKGARPVWWNDGWAETPIFEQMQSSLDAAAYDAARRRWKPLVMTTPSLDLAVALGAAYYAWLKHTGGRRIGGGSKSKAGYGNRSTQHQT